MEKYTSYQLASMIILFEIGSSPLFLLAADAKRDAWIAVLVAMVCGMALLVFVTLAIHRQEPSMNLIEIIFKYCGNWVGQFIVWPYVIYFLYKSVRNVREFGDLMIEYLIPYSPLTVVTAVLMLISSYAVYMGVEVFFRVAESLLPIIGFLYFILLILVLMDGIIHLNNLLPLLADGFRPVVSAALPEVISFPFGEMVLFLMFWKHANSSKNVLPASLTAYSMAGLFLVFMNAIIVSVLGSSLATAGGIPLMIIASVIQIGRIIERMDPLVAILLFTGVLIKQTAYYLGATMALSTIFRKPHRYMIVPAGLAIYIGSLLFRSFMQQIWFGFQYNVKYHFPVFQIVLPILLLIVMKIRRKRMEETDHARIQEEQTGGTAEEPSAWSQLGPEPPAVEEPVG